MWSLSPRDCAARADVVRMRLTLTPYNVFIRVMTLFHFANCLAVTVAPYLILYRFSGLSDMPWSKCVKSAVGYVITQLVKMLLLATAFPVSAVQTERDDLVRVALTCTVDVIDLLGIYVCLTKFTARYENSAIKIKVLSTVVGWGVMEVVATRVVPLWVNARGVEFSWSSLFTGLDANISLVYLTATVALLWLWSRPDLNQTLLPLLLCLLLSLCYSPLLLYLLTLSLDPAAWVLLGVRLGVGLVTGALTLLLFGAMNSEKTKVQ